MLGAREIIRRGSVATAIERPSPSVMVRLEDLVPGGLCSACGDYCREKKRQKVAIVSRKRHQ